MRLVQIFKHSLQLFGREGQVALQALAGQMAGLSGQGQPPEAGGFWGQGLTCRSCRVMKPLASLSHNRNSSWACSSIVAGGPGLRPCSHPSSSWASPAPGFPGLAMEVGLAFGGPSRAEKR